MIIVKNRGITASSKTCVTLVDHQKHLIQSDMLYVNEFEQKILKNLNF